MSAREREHQQWITSLCALARAAGEASLVHYRDDLAVDRKADFSPVTAADRAAHEVIARGLAQLAPRIPLLSEEGAHLPWSEREGWERYWLVDPLDGTREFIKRNGEFSVNIALIEGGAPVLGVVHAPVGGQMCWGVHGVGAYSREGGEDIALHVRRPASAPLRVMASRSHRHPKVDAMLARMPATECDGLGSSLKFLRLAEGLADLYPRFGPTSEWDTAAGQAVLEAAGGAVLDLEGRPLAYNQREGLLNPDFIAVGDASLPWKEWLDAA